MRRIRLGIAGAGMMGKTHLCNSLRLKNVETVAIADASKRALSKIPVSKLNLYDDYGEMIRKEQMDAVIIALPNHLHKDCAKIAAEAGCDLLIEKPLARTGEEAKEIADVVRRTNTRLMVGMCQRFATDCQKLKQDMDVGDFGRVDFASGLFFTGPFLDGTRVSEWLFDPQRVGGALLDTGCHLIDLFLWYFGEVSSVSGRRESLLHLGYDDYAQVLMKFKCGVNALIAVGWRTRIPCYRIEIVGEYGRRVVVNKRFGIFDVGLLRAGMSLAKENLSRKMRGGPLLPLGEEYYKELKYFVKCLLAGVSPQPSIDDWLKVAEIVDQVYATDLIEH